MWHGRLLSIGTCLLATQGLAAERYYCAVDDANIKLSIDAGFVDAPGRKLNHFRGALIAKSAQVPDDFRKLMLDSSQLSENWSFGDDLRLAIVAYNGNGDNAASAELVVLASGKGNAAPMQGSYTLTFGTPDNAKPVKLTGRLTCNAQ